MGRNYAASAARPADQLTPRSARRPRSDGAGFSLDAWTGIPKMGGHDTQPRYPDVAPYGIQRWLWRGSPQA